MFLIGTRSDGTTACTHSRVKFKLEGSRAFLLRKKERGDSRNGRLLCLKIGSSPAIRINEAVRVFSAPPLGRISRSGERVCLQDSTTIGRHSERDGRAYIDWTDFSIVTHVNRERNELYICYNVLFLFHMSGESGSPSRREECNIFYAG